MFYIFLDTNIFIHFQDFEQIDWNDLLDTSDQIEICIAPIVIDELDKHKYSSNRKIQKRVKRILPKIESLVEHPEQCKFRFNFITQKPSLQLFDKYSLDPKDQDDCLLATIIQFADSSSEKIGVALITNDVGPRLKAKSLSILVFKPSDEYLLADEPDEIEIENNRLRKENQDLKQRVPLVSLSFPGNKQFQTFTKAKFNLEKSDFVISEMAVIRRNYPPIIKELKDEEETNKTLASYRSVIPPLSDDQIKAYNNSLQLFYTKYENHLESLYKKKKFKSNTIEIHLELNNLGTSPAEDIDVELYFPDGFDLFDESQLPKKKKKPEPPYKPKHMLDYNLKNLLLPNVYSHISSNTKALPGPNFPTIKKTNSYNVNYHFDSLKHNQVLQLEPLIVKFEKIELAENFNIKYWLKISNVPHVIEGNLNVIFKDAIE